MNSLKDKGSPSEIGERVKIVRVMTGLTLRSFSDQTNISFSTMRSWENPAEKRRGLTEKGALRLTKELLDFNIDCSIEWLIFGVGEPPKRKGDAYKSESLIYQPSWGVHEVILREIQTFEQLNPDPLVLQVKDKGMRPYFDLGDYVAGNRVFGDKIKELVGQNCIVETAVHTLVRRIVSEDNGLFTLATLNHDKSIKEPLISMITIASAAEIVWHRRTPSK